MLSSLSHRACYPGFDCHYASYLLLQKFRMYRF